MIVIKGWSEKFECAESRKRGDLRWYSCPVGLTSTGYMILAGIEGGFAAFGIFQAICQLHADKSPREQRLEGIVSRGDGTPLSLEMIRVHLRATKKQLDDALKILTSEDVGWIAHKIKDSHETPTTRPSDAQATPKQRPSNARHSTVQYKTVQDITQTGVDADAGVCLKIIEEVSKAYGSPSSRVSAEAKRELWEANKSQAFTDDDLTLVVRFIRKHRAGKFGNNAPKIAQSASRAIAGFVELLARAEAHKADVEPYKAPPVMKSPEPEEISEESRKEIAAHLKQLKHKLKQPNAEPIKKDATNA